MTPFSHRDTRAWTLQAWTSFGLATACCALGLAWLPGQDLDRAFMVMGYLFCLSAAFVLSKFVRDQARDVAGAAAGGDTPMFRLVVWGGFAAAMALTAWGLWRMQVSGSYKAFLGIAWLYLISSGFTLAKTLRDRHDADATEAPAQTQDAA
ncbi:MAG TPA: YiaA/YiaB family inner membrane protein [Pseudorhodoferax sp.]|jgi:hypothetical protein|nr:YiaA/YiaB family inner membrane protein [Pseudorhodoferax sp.]